MTNTEKEDMHNSEQWQKHWAKQRTYRGKEGELRKQEGKMIVKKYLVNSDFQD